jgi:hypothetical protein
MIIANPIYDIVFKYLLEDLDISRELLSLIIEEEIISLEVKPQESIVEVANGLRVFRYDFKAIILLPDGSHKKILIELQKAKVLLDVSRFRLYLGDNYSKDDDIFNEVTQKMESHSLPIVAIYILGFKLDAFPTPVLKVGNFYEDKTTGQILMPLVKEKFVDQLTHDSYMIQLPRLKKGRRTRLEHVLQLFDQTQKVPTDRHKLEYVEDPNNTDALIRKIKERLLRAVADDEMRTRMRIEDELERTYYKDLRAKDEIIEQKDEIIIEKEQVIVQKEQVIVQKEQVIVQKEQVIVETKQELKQTKQELVQKEQVIEQTKQELVQKEQELLQKEQELAQLRLLLEQKNK